jgi:hypothetical protein
LKNGRQYQDEVDIYHKALSQLTLDHFKLPSHCLTGFATGTLLLIVVDTLSAMMQEVDDELSKKSKANWSLL